MKPRIIFKCTNDDCEQYAKEFMLHCPSLLGSGKEEHREYYWTVINQLCRSCYRKGEVKIKHGNRTFSNIEAFDEYILGVANAAKLLRKLVDKGIAEPEDKEQFDKSIELLQDVTCSCCGRPLIELVVARAEAQPFCPDDLNKLRA